MRPWTRNRSSNPSEDPRNPGLLGSARVRWKKRIKTFNVSVRVASNTIIVMIKALMGR
jgi:hypothetical protein